MQIFDSVLFFATLGPERMAALDCAAGLMLSRFDKPEPICCYYLAEILPDKADRLLEVGKQRPGTLPARIMRTPCRRTR